MLGLKWENVNFADKTIKISSSVVQVKNRSETAKTNYELIEQDSTKTISGDRIIYINQKAVEALREIQKINSDVEYVMSNANKNITNPRNIDRMFRNILARCDIEPCGVHTLRHTAATNMHQLTGDFYTVGEILGHTLKGIGMSLGISTNLEAVTARYVDVRLERKNEVLETYHKVIHETGKNTETGEKAKAPKKKKNDMEL